MRLFALLATLLLVFETTGAARAFGEVSTVHCCCGAHRSDHACGCRTCPAGVGSDHGNGKARRGELPREARIAPCFGAGQDRAVPSVPAIPPAAPPGLAPPAPAPAPPSGALPFLLDQVPVASRPPP